MRLFTPTPYDRRLWGSDMGPLWAPGLDGVSLPYLLPCYHRGRSFPGLWTLGPLLLHPSLRHRTVLLESRGTHRGVCPDKG